MVLLVLMGLSNFLFQGVLQKSALNVDDGGQAFPH